MGKDEKTDFVVGGLVDSHDNNGVGLCSTRRLSSWPSMALLALTSRRGGSPINAGEGGGRVVSESVDEK